MENGWTERIKELEAENIRLRMLRDAAESRAQGLEAENKRLRGVIEKYNPYDKALEEASHEG